MSFGGFSPTVKNLLTQAVNSWSGQQIYSKKNLATTTTAVNRFVNPTAAASGAQQVSPSEEFEGQGWKTSSTASSMSVKFDRYVLPIQGTTAPLGAMIYRYSINNAAYTNLMELYTSILDGVAFPSLKFNGMIESSVNNSSTIGTLQNLLLTNPSGSKTQFAVKFSTTIKSGITFDSSGNVEFKSTNQGTGFGFYAGTNIESTNLLFQIYSGGTYNYGGSFNQGKVTAGQADITPPAYLNTYGSFAGNGKTITDAAYTITENDFVLYGDADTAFLCSGTPSVTACSSYSGSGEATCISHLPCTWSSGNSCGDFSSTDLSTCESHSGCTFSQSSCSGPSDQISCESQDDAYGGSCVWDTSTCSSQTSTASCGAISGCSATVDNDCSSLSDGGGDGSMCGTQSECSYDSGSGACSGTYFNFCSGDFCSGSYYNGTCSGTYGSGCFGTVSCASYLSSGACTAEAGCSASSGATWTLPITAQANKGNTSRFHYVKNIGASATISVVAGSGDDLESSISLTPGHGALLHSHLKSALCSGFLSEGACTPSGCSWNPAIVCSDYNGNESGCTSVGCSYSDPDCTGAGTPANCSGTYVASKRWYKHATI